MPGIAGTVSLPSRSAPAIPALAGVGFPAVLPGGMAGLSPLPSTLLAPPGAAPAVAAWPTFPTPGGHYGPVRYFTPSIDKQVPYGAGWNMGKSIRSTDGGPIWWRRFFLRNSAGAHTFVPQGNATPSWSSNTQDLAPARPSSPIPMSNKHISTGGLYREFYVNEQLFDQLTDRQHPWPIQKPVPFRVQQAAAQPKQRRPYFYQLTRYTPAASYGQTAQTLLSQALNNTLPALYTGGGPNNPPVLGGSPYGSY
jgi:hypothetical protein